MEQTRNIVYAFLAGLIIGAGGFWAATRVSDLNIGASSPLEKISVVSSGSPGSTVPAEAFRRLDAMSAAKWRLEFFAAGKEDFANTPLAPVEADLRALADLPDVQGSDVRGVFTNLFDAESVAANGALYFIWFDLPNKARTYFLSEPTVFTDQAREDARDSYWVGSFAVFYSPAGAGADRTEDLREFFKVFAQCPNTAGPCVVPRDLKQFDDWAPRADADG